jgi:hypothetical protein
MVLLVIQQLLALMLVARVVITLIPVGVEHVILPNLLVIDPRVTLVAQMFIVLVTHAV